MNRRLQGFALVYCVIALGHPETGLAQSQSQEDPLHQVGVVTAPSGPEVSDDSLMIGHPRRSDTSVLMLGRPRNPDPDDPWSDVAMDAFSSIGFYRMNDDVRAHLKLSKDRGLIVARVAPNSPEHTMGIRENDILLSLGDISVASPADLVGALKRIGDKPTPLVLLRNGENVTIQVQPRVQHGLSPVKSEQSIYVIGVMTTRVNPLLRSQLKLPEGQGLAIRHIDENGPATKVKLAVGDILLAINGKPVGDEIALSKLIQENGEKPIVLEAIHEGSKKTATLTPVRRTSEANQFNIGITDRPHVVIRRGSDGDGSFEVLSGEVVVHQPSARYPSGHPPIVGRTTIGRIDPQRDGNGTLLKSPLILRERPAPELLGKARIVDSMKLEPAPKAQKATSPDPVAKRLDEMSSQIDAIRKVVDDLAKVLKDKK